MPAGRLRVHARLHGFLFEQVGERGPDDFRGEFLNSEFRQRLGGGAGSVARGWGGGCNGGLGAPPGHLGGVGRGRVRGGLGLAPRSNFIDKAPALDGYAELHKLTIRRIHLAGLECQLRRLVLAAQGRKGQRLAVVTFDEVGREADALVRVVQSALHLVQLQEGLGAVGVIDVVGGLRLDGLRVTGGGLKVVAALKVVVPRGLLRLAHPARCHCGKVANGWW
mmetsp:Transcript_4608/g.13494  ORF Transcript_4608/g.13494 Transcript_4608/m.13494 type:complete len:222 (+) Transcript_4608:817-1482(+)